mmetsp:Transcript_16740/g.52819  ORF Transcript_16740/g.52819 Transcript_16740/m.52819 type:complete len:328 (-) Transcript_16740:1010-1993(-)
MVGRGHRAQRRLPQPADQDVRGRAGRGRSAGDRQGRGVAAGGGAVRHFQLPHPRARLHQEGRAGHASQVDHGDDGHVALAHRHHRDGAGLLHGGAGHGGIHHVQGDAGEARGAQPQGGELADREPVPRGAPGTGAVGVRRPQGAHGGHRLPALPLCARHRPGPRGDLQVGGAREGGGGLRGAHGDGPRLPAGDQAPGHVRGPHRALRPRGGPPGAQGPGGVRRYAACRGSHGHRGLHLQHRPRLPREQSQAERRRPRVARVRYRGVHAHPAGEAARQQAPQGQAPQGLPPHGGRGRRGRLAPRQQRAGGHGAFSRGRWAREGWTRQG